MKKIISTLLFLAILIQAKSTVHTVSNDATNPAQFNNISTALAAANPGDTLYVYGTPNNYGDLVINKSITIIGPGFNARKEMFAKCVFGNVDFAPMTLNNVELNGICCIHFGLPFTGVYNYSNITIRNCIAINGFGAIGGNGAPCGSTLDNWIIENTVLGDFGMAYNTVCNPATPITNNFLVRKSIIFSMGGGGRNMNFVNCNMGLNGSGFNFQGSQGCNYDNCIFMNVSFQQSSANLNNVFHNCLTFQTNSPSQNFDLNSWTGGATGSATGCIINQNPLWFTAPTFSLFFISPATSPNVWDPSLQPSSPALNAGTDGTDIGLTGSFSPYHFRAEPNIPVVRTFQLVNSVVPGNGTVTLKATATKAQ